LVFPKFSFINPISHAGLFSNKIAEFEEKAKELEKFCQLAEVYLDAAAKSGEYREEVKLAEARAMKDLKRIEAATKEIMKEIHNL
jgi:hypothetical protein